MTFPLQDSLKWSSNENLLLVWYEDILKNFEEEVDRIAAFTGFNVNPDQLKVI